MGFRPGPSPQPRLTAQPRARRRAFQHERHRPRIAARGTPQRPHSPAHALASHAERGTPRRVACPLRDLGDFSGWRAQRARVHGSSPPCRSPAARLSGRARRWQRTPPARLDAGRPARERAPAVRTAKAFEADGADVDQSRDGTRQQSIRGAADAARASGATAHTDGTAPDHQWGRSAVRREARAGPCRCRGCPLTSH